MADNPIKVKAYGKILSFPAGTAPEAIESALAEHEHVLNPDYKAPQPEALDYAKGFASGANKLGAGVGFLMEAAGAKESGRATREFFNRGAKYWNDKMSKGGKLASQSQVFVDDDNEDSITGIKLSDDWGKALLMGASQSLPSMFAAAIPGVAVTKGIQALAKLGLAGGAGATIPLLAGTAAPVGVTSNVIARVPSAVGFGAAEGVTAGAMNAADFKTSIEGMTDEELNKSPVYRALKEEHDPETARSLLAEQAAIDLFGKTAVSTGTIGALTGGGALSQAYQKVTTGAQSGILGTMLKGAGSEALQETPQSGGEKFIENLTTQKFLNPDQNTTEGVLAAAASGGAIGAFTGGVVGAGGAINITPDRRSQLLNEKRKVAEMKADAVNNRTMEESAAEIGAAQDIDQALAAAMRATTKPVVSANEVLRSEDPTLADIEKLTGLKPTEAIDTAIDEIENPIINRPQETENVSNQETQQAPTTQASVLNEPELPKATPVTSGTTDEVEGIAGRPGTQANTKAAVKTVEDTSTSPVDVSIGSLASGKTSASWMVRNKESGEVLFETFDKKKVDNLNTDKYEAVPAYKYLTELNSEIKGKPPEKKQSAKPSFSVEGLTDKSPVMNEETFKAKGIAEPYSAYLKAHPNKSEAIKADIKHVENKLVQGLQGTGKFDGKTNHAYATPFREFYKVNAERLGIMPSELYERLPLKFKGSQDTGEVLKQEGIDLADTPGIKEFKKGDTTVTYGNEGGVLKIYSMRTPVAKRGKGSARAAMESLIAQADKEGKAIILDSSPLDKRTKDRRLFEFYTSLGFKPTGKKINPVGDPEMQREPSVSSVSRKTSTNNTGEFNPNDPNILKQSTFYSALEKEIGNLKKIANKNGEVSVDQAKAWINSRQKEGKFKQAEVEAVGLMDWLDTLDGKVPVVDVENFVRENGVKVEEVILEGEGESEVDDEQVYDEAYQGFIENYDEPDDSVYDDAILDTAREMLQDHSDERWGLLDLNGEDEVEDWLEGGEVDAGLITEMLRNKSDPEEILGEDTYNEIRADAEQSDWENQQDYYMDMARERMGAGNTTGGTEFQDYVLRGGDKGYKELLMTLPDSKAKFNAPHFDRAQGAGAENIFAHTRINEREMDVGPTPEQVAEKEAYDAWEAGNNTPEIKQILKEKDEAARAYRLALGGWQQSMIEDASVSQAEYNKRIGEVGSNPPEELKPFIARIDEVGAKVKALQEERLAVKPKQPSTSGAKEKVLFIEEIQSDWAQKGRDEGFRGDRLSKEQTVRKKELEEFLRRASIDVEGREAIHKAQAEFGELKQLEGVGKVAKAPFVTDTKAWTALVVKRLLRYAAENGFDRIAWTTGAQQAERYRLDKFITEVTARRVKDLYQVEAIAEDGLTVFDDLVAGKDLAGTLGAELAEKIINQGEGTASYTGLEIRSGGQGMREFYDRIVPSVVNDVAKKLGGGKVEIVSMGGQAGRVVKGLDGKILITYPNGSYLKNRNTGVMTESQDRADGFESVEEATKFLDRYEAQNLEEPGRQMSLRITPAMKDKVMQGLPLFQRDRAGFNPRTFTISLMDGSDLSSVIHEGGHFYLEALAEMASQPNAPEQIVNDFDTTLQWFGIGEQAQGATDAATRTQGYPTAAGGPVATFRKADDIKSHPRYAEAKAGDIKAAFDLVSDLVTEENLNEATMRFAGATFVPVSMIDKDGANRLPTALAYHYANAAGGSVSDSIFESRKAYHTGMNAMERLVSRANFSGKVEPGRKYVLVDDVTTVGSTLADLASYIQENGGEVIGSVLLANATRSGNMFANVKTLKRLEEQYGNEIRELFSIEPSALTQEEAQYLIGFRNADELRSSAVKAQGSRLARIHAREISKGQSSVDRQRLRDIWQSMSLEQKRPYHEQWAQSFERYALEGKAPTKEMQSVFDRFQEWMLDVYKSLKEFLKQNPLAGKLNDEVRSVFDRLLATEQDIAKSREAPTKERSLKNGERAKQLERKLREQGYDFTITAKDVRDFAAGDRGKEIEANTAEKIAGIFGRKIVWIDAQGDYDINGVVVPSIKDTIFIDVNTDKAAHAVMGHELSHHLEHDNPDVYDDLLDALSTVIKDYQGYAKKYGIEGVRKDDITKEIVGDIMGDNFTKPEFWNRVAEANPSTFKSIADSIIKWLKNLILKAKSRGLGSDQWVTDSQKAQDILAKAIAKYEGLNDSVAEDGAKFHKVWHGSPHDHSKFDSAKIGTGEGAQAYGYGHYFADRKEVAEFYKENVKDMVRVREINAELSDLSKIMNKYETSYRKYSDPKGYEAAKRYDELMAERDGERTKLGKLYEVELAPEQEDYLLWDKPLSEQSEKVKKALLEIDIPLTDSESFKSQNEVLGPLGMEVFKKGVVNQAKGNDVYVVLSSKIGGARRASEYLHSLGIRGIKYLDGSSRSTATRQRDRAEKVNRIKEVRSEIESLRQEINLNKNNGGLLPAFFKRREADITERESIIKDIEKQISDIDNDVGVHHNFVIFNDADVTITAKFSKKATELKFTKADMSGAKFETGKPVTFTYMHNKDSATSIFGKPKKDSSFNRYYDPSGKYVTFTTRKEVPDYGNFEIGSLTFNNPLVIENDNLEWKKDLSNKYGGLRGKALSQAVIADGYDGIVTVDKSSSGEPYTSEILDLTTFDESIAKFSKKAAENTLIVQHNLTVKNLLHADRMGGLAAPSIAVTDKSHPLTGFGEITLLAEKDLIDPQKGAKIFGSDIYSPRYPQLSYDFTGKPIEKLKEMFADGVAKTGDSGFYNDSLQDDPFRELLHNSAAMHQFLTEQGKKPKIVYTKPKPLSDPDLKPFLTFKGDSFDLSKDEKFRAVVKNIFEVKEDYKLDDDGVSNMSRAYAEEVMKHRDAKKNTGKVDRQFTNSSLFRQIGDAKLMNKFENYLVEVINKAEPKERIFQGYTYSGTRRYLPHDIDTVVKLLQKDLRGGENFKYGLGSVRAKYSKQFKSIEQIRNSKNSLMSSEDFDAVKKEVNAELDTLSEALNKYGTFSGSSNVESMLSDAAKLGINRALKENGFENVPDRLKIDAQNFLNKLKDMPTEYFEAKLIRRVGLGEFTAAVVPKDTPAQALEILKKNGITDIRKYKSGDKDDRIAQIGKLDRVMFSRKVTDIPETINIDGEAKPTRNSNGQLIHPTEEGIRNFWKWFGDSEARQWPESSRGDRKKAPPLVLYHGTKGDFNEFVVGSPGFNSTLFGPWETKRAGLFFTEDKKFAEGFANQGESTQGANVIPVYLKVENAIDLTKGFTDEAIIEALTEIGVNPRVMYNISADQIWGMFDEEDEGSFFVGKLKELGYDGAVIVEPNSATNESVESWVVFDPAQVKSAIGNTGEFSKKNDDIRFSKSAEPFDPNTDIPETLPRKAQRLTQDAFNRFTVIQNWLKEKGVTLSEKADVYQAEERYHSLVANQLEDFREQKRNPLIEKIAKAGFTMADVSDFLEAQHAAEANAAIQKISNNDTDTAYGITDEEAADYLAKADPKLAKLANELRDITEESKQMRLKAGLLSQDEVDAWESTYEHYIPVKGDADAKGGTGKGLKVNFKTKRRLGHGKRDEAVIENIFLDHERAIMQVEKNRVAKHLVMMAAEMQMPEIMTVGQPVKRKTLRNTTAYEVKVSGVTRSVFNNKQAADMFKQLLPDLDKGVSPNDISVEQTKDQRIVAMASPMLAENEINAYIDGHAIRVQINDDLLARAYAKLGVTGFSALVSAGRAFNGYLSKVYTGYNPEFIVTNMIRDFTSGLINLTGEEGIKMAAKASGNYVKSFSSLMRYAMSNGKKSDKWIDMYRANGGNTGAAYLSDLERLGDEVKTEYAAYQGVMANLKSGSFANAARASGRKVFNLTLKWIYNLNQAGENAMRLAAFRAMIESGKTPAQAAKVAKNITVNFNRKGELGAEANAAYLFFNASVQGVAALAHAHFKGGHKYQAWGLSSMVGVLGYMAAAALLGGDDDEYDKLNDYTKSRNLLIKAGEGYAQIPIPYGYGFFWNMGRSIAEAQHKGELGNLPWHIAASAIEELTPFSDTVVGTQDGFHFDQVLLGLLPTVVKIPAQPAFNKQLFSGSELMPDSAFQQFQPDREKLWRATQGTMYDRMSGWLDEAIGADVSPETLKHYTRTFTGGAGAMVDATVSAAMLKKEGAELEPSEIPFVRKAYSKLTIREHRAAYYKAREEAKKTAEEFTRAKARNDVTTINKLVKDEAEMIGLDAYANKLSKAISAMRDMQDAIRLDDNLNAAEKRTKIKELEITEQKFYDQYLDVFKIEKAKMKSRGD